MQLMYLRKKIGIGILSLLILVIICVYFLYNFASAKASFPKAQAGVTDLSAWDFIQQGPIELAGEWEFYWQQLLTPPDFVSAVSPPMTGYIKIPGLWNGYIIEGEGEDKDESELGGFGFATYRAIIKTRGENDLLAIRLLDFATSYKLWVNGQLLASNGRVGIKAEESEPQSFPQIVNFMNNREEIELVLQVANFTHRKGGLWSKMQLGTDSQMQSLRERKAAGVLFLNGGLAIMAFYHFGLFYLRRKDLSNFFLAMLCLLVALRASVTGEIVLVNLIPTLSWHMIYIMQYLTFYLAVPCFIQFIYLLYPKETGVFLVKLVWITAGLFSLPVLLTPAQIYTRFILTYEILTIILLIYIILFVLLKAIKNQREGPVFFFLGTIIMVLAVINDTLVANGAIWWPYITEFAMFIFLFLQTFVLSARFSKAFLSVEQLSEDLKDALSKLEEYSQSLEQRVHDRTLDLEAAKKAAEAANQAKGDFLAIMSHEIRTPLNALVGISELLGRTSFTGEQQEYVTTIKECADLVMEIIEDLLDFSKIEEGKLLLSEADYDLRVLTQGVADLIEPKARQKGLTFTIDAEIKLNQVLRGDSLRLRQILLNLLSNAVKFTHSGAISLKVAQHKDNLYWEVKDTGRGIAAEYKKYIFEPFIQGEATTFHQYGGSGLGLSICKRLVGLMGGSIWFESEVGTGTTFWFTVPLQLGRKDVVAENVNGKVDFIWEENHKPVLVVEDFAINRSLILAQLKKIGLEADVVADGVEALAATAETDYSLVLMDCQMPNMNGYEATAAIRQQDALKGRHTPIIAITAGSLSSEREKCLAAGMDDYLRKPIRLADLQELLVRWLGTSGSPQFLPPNLGKEENFLAELTFADPKTRGKLMEMVNGDLELLAKIIKAYLGDMPVKLASLQNAVNRGDSRTACLQSHGMKSSSLMIGLTSLAEQCQALEEVAAAGDLSGSAILLSNIEKKYRQNAAELAEFLEKKS